MLLETPQQLQKLDSSITVRGLKASLGVEKRENKDFVLYEVPYLWASSQVTLAQVRIYLKLSWHGTHLQKQLLHSASLSTAHPKLKLFFDEVKQGLSSTGRNIHHIKHMNVPKKWRRKLLQKQLRLSLLRKQTALLKAKLPQLGAASAPQSGRGSLSLSAKVCLPLRQKNAAHTLQGGLR